MVARRRFFIRLNTDGSNDTSFGSLATPGASLVSFGGNSRSADVTLEPVTGKPVVTGGVDNRWVVARYTTAGALDTTFNAGGPIPGVNALATSGGGTGVVVAGGGRVAISGAGLGTALEPIFAVARFTSAGVVDPTFTSGVGVTGPALTPLGDGNQSAAFDLVVGPDDLPILVGVALDSAKQKLTLARFGGSNQTPTARFFYSPSAPREGQQVTFDGRSSSDPDGTNVSYAWDFDGQPGFETSGSTPSTSFLSPGQHDVTLRVTDNRGASAQSTTTINVAVNQAPVASFTITPDPIRRGISEQLTATASDPDGSVASYRWDFTNDGTFDTAASAQATTTHTFTAIGTTTTRLRVVDDEGKATETTQTFTVGSQVPVARLTAPAKAEINERITLDGAASTDPDGTVASYRWDANGDGVFELFSFSPQITTSFDSEGPKVVRLKVTDNDGAESEPVSTTVTVANGSPFAMFTIKSDTKANGSPSTQVGYPINFEVSASDDDGYVAKYEWDFEGDGTYIEKQGPNTSHVYDQPGTYTVRLRVTDDLGLSFNAEPSDLYVSPASEPRFSLVNTEPYGALGVRRGDEASVDLKIYREYGSAGPVTFSAALKGAAPNGSVLAQGVTYRIDPYNGTPDRFRLTVAATPFAPPIGPKDLIVVATPSSAAVGEKPDSLRITLAVTADIDVAVRAVEVNQGTQDRTSFKLTAANVARYTGVPLVAGKKTLVRVEGTSLPDLDTSSRTEGGVKGVTAALAGTRNGRFLAGSPLLPEFSPASLLPPDINRIAEAGGAYVFTLPPSWTKAGAIRLSAGLTQPKAYTDGKVFNDRLSSCPTPECAANDSLKLEDVSFAVRQPVTVRPMAATWERFKPDREAGPVRPAAEVFARSKAVTPVAETDVHIHPYAATFDVSKIAALPVSLKKTPALGDGDATFDENADGGDIKNGKVLDQAALELEKNAAAPAQSRFDTGASTITVNTVLARGLARSATQIAGTAHPVAVVEQNRPLTSVGHELFHLYGREHASKACGGGDNGQVGDDWPADQWGYTQGVGLDTSAAVGSAGSLKFGSSGVTGGPQPGKQQGKSDFQDDAFFDFMSYCAGTGEANVWTSPLGWRRTIDLREANPASARNAGLPRAATGGSPTGGSLYLNGFVTQAGTTVLDQVARLQTPPDAPVASAYSVVARGTAGAPVTAPLAATGGHVDQSGPITLLSGAIPLPAGDRVASLTVLRDGRELASRLASPNAPTVTVTSPRAGTRLRGKTVKVAWKQADADGDQLRSIVSYSEDGGKTWTARWIGSDRTSITLPPRFFTASKRGRVRVEVSDGLNEATAVSGVFSSEGAPPTVTIDPVGKAKVPNDASLYFSGSAYDEADRVLRGKALRWKAGRRTIGRGESISVADLPLGTRKIVLEAKDRLGRVGRASVAVRLKAVAPRILTLKAPRKASGRSVALKLSVSLTSRLTVTGGARQVRAKVGRRARTVHVRLRGGKTPVRLKLEVAAAGKSSAVRVQIRR